MPDKWDKYAVKESKWDKYKVQEDIQSDGSKIEIGAKGSIADRFNNPGNLRFAGQQGAEEKEGWAAFSSPEEGFNALKKDIDIKKTRNLTLSQMMNVYAPPTENDTDNYIKNLSNALNVTPDTNISDIPTDSLAKAIAKIESGTEVGDVKTISEEPKLDSTTSQFKYQQPMQEQPDYMGLFNRKEDYKIANDQGVSVSFFDEVNKAASQAERPVEFIAEANNLRKRVKEIPNYFPELAGQASELEKMLTSVNRDNIEDIRKQVENLEMRTVGQQISQGNFFVPSAKRQEYYDKVVNDPTVSAIRMLSEDNRDLQEAVASRGEGLMGASRNIAKGSQKGLENYVEGYTQLLQDLKGNKAVNEVLTKLENEEELTTDDRLLLKAIYANSQLHESLDKNIPASYRIGESVGQSAGFMGEFMLTGGLVGGVGKGVLKQAAKMGITSKAGKLGVNAAIKLAQTGVQTPLMPSLWKGTAIDVSKGEEFIPAFINNAWQTAAETGSERIFLANPVSGAAGGIADRVMRMAGINFAAERGAVGLLKNMGEEYLEEKAGEIMTAPKDYKSFKEFWNNFTSGQKNLEMFASTSIITGGMGSVAIAGNAVSKARHEARVKKLEKFIPADLRAEIDAIVENEEITVQEMYSLIGDNISQRIDAMELGEDPATTTGNAMAYAAHRIQGMAAEATDVNAKIKNGQITVGDVEEEKGSEEKLAYLKERGVEVPDGTNMEGLDKLYTEEKAKTSPTSETIKTKESEKLTETQSQNVDKQQNSVSEVSPELTKTGTVEKVGEQKVEFEQKKADIEKRRQEELNIEQLPIDRVKRKNGAIGTQGVTTEQIADILKNVLGLNVPENATMKDLVNLFISDKANVDKLLEFTNRNPINITELPDGTIQINDGHHRAFLLDQAGITELPATRSKSDEINAKYDAELQQLESEVQNAEEIARQVSPTVPQEGTEGGGIGQGGVRDTKQDKATAAQVAPATEKEKKENKKIITKKQKDVTGRDVRNGRDGNGQEVQREQLQLGKEPEDKATEEREETPEADTQAEKVKYLYQSVSDGVKTLTMSIKKMVDKKTKETIKEVEGNFKTVVKDVRDKLWDSVNKKHITSGQHRGILTKISALTTSDRKAKDGRTMAEKRLQELNDYVDSVLNKADYSNAVKGAKKFIKEVSKKNRKDKSIFGEAKKLADAFEKIDPDQMTLEELQEFNKFAEKILTSKKVPDIASLEAAVDQFGDTTKSKEDAFMHKLEEAVAAAELGNPKLLADIRKDFEDAVDEITAEKIETVSQYMTARRRAASARRKLDKMLNAGVITEEEADAYWSKITPEENGEIEKQLAEFKKEYAKQVHEAAKSKKTKEAVNELSDIKQERIRELMNISQEQIESLSISEIEALDNVIKNLQLGYLTPEAFQLRRKLNAMNKSKSFLDKFSKKAIAKTIIDKVIRKGGDKIKDVFGKIVDATKVYRLDELFGNTDRHNSINAAGTSFSSAVQKESNANEKFQKKRMDIYKILEKKFGMSVGESLLSTKIGKKLFKLSKGPKEQFFTNLYNKTREFTNFLIERSYQQEDVFKNGELGEATYSRLASQFDGNDETEGGKNKLSEYWNDKALYEKQVEEAKSLGLTRKVSWKDKDGNVVKKDIIDTEKYEAHLREDPEMAKLIDLVDSYLEEMREYAEVATMENGRTFIGKEKYFPFRSKESGRETDQEDIKKHLEYSNQYPKMQANSTFSRKGSTMWLDNDLMKVLEFHTKEIMRNYHVYPESRATMEAINKSFNNSIKEQKESGAIDSQDADVAKTIRDMIKDTFKNRIAKYYNSGKYSVDYNKTGEVILKGGKQGMLLNPIRPLAEFPANVMRATIAIGQIPSKALSMSKKHIAIVDSIMNDYLGDRYWSSYSSELGAVSARRMAAKKIQDMADWFIMVSDKAVGRVLFRHEMMKSFKELTGEEFNPDEYASNPEYRVKHKEDIHKSASWALKRTEELFNEKSPLSSALLTTFMGGTIKRDPGKTTTKIFDILQSFQRNEVQQLMTAAKRMQDPETRYMAYRDITAVLLSNVSYQILRRGLGVAFTVGVAKVLGQALSDYEDEQKKKLFSKESLMRDLRRSAEGLIMGGSANIYTAVGKIAYFTVMQSDILTEKQKKKFEEVLIEDLYATKIPTYGTPKQILQGVLPIPSTMTKDAFATIDGVASVIASLKKSNLTKEQEYEIFNLINLGFKYAMPNLGSPMIQKSIERKINEEKRKEMRRKKGDEDNNSWFPTEEEEAETNESWFPEEDNE